MGSKSPLRGVEDPPTVMVSKRPKSKRPFVKKEKDSCHKELYDMNPDALMNTATALFFMCYIPEFYANYVNKNANVYNVVEKVVLLLGTGFALGYAVETRNQTLIVNYAPLFIIDATALSMRAYYAYRNRARDVRALSIQAPEILEDVENPIHDPLEEL